jgi:phosphoserine phosphatase RsbU/P
VKIPLRVLIIEDSEFDGQMMVNLLRRGGYDVSFERVETAEAMRTALVAKPWNLVLADYNLPDFNAPDALKVLQQTGLDLPFIIVSGGIGEDIAVASMKAGAHDYLMKGNLNRLAPAVDRELRESANRASQREARKALLESERRYRLLWETCPDAILLMDRSGRIQFANPAVRDVFGFTPEELVGENYRLLQPDRSDPQNPTGFDRFILGGAKPAQWRAVESLGRRKDGAEIPIEVSFSDMDLDGDRRLVAFIRDVTARKRVERELSHNKEQFAVAREIQQRLFPKTAPECPGFDIAGTSYPAEETGGDYFDFLPMLNDCLGVVVADVSGHGVGPAMLMAETRAYLRLLATRRDSLGEILSRANSMFLARIHLKSRELDYASAGHPASYVLDSNGNVKATLRRTGIPLGMRPDTEYKSAPPIALASGDLVLLLTDGIEEAPGPEDSVLGIERILEVVRQHRERPARQIVEALYAETRSFTQHAPQDDDITAIIIKAL